MGFVPRGVHARCEREQYHDKIYRSMLMVVDGFIIFFGRISSDQESSDVRNR